MRAKPTSIKEVRAAHKAWKAKVIITLGEGTMPLYMTHFAYTSEAWAALAKNPEDRKKAVDAAAQKFGGRVVDLYYHFGDYDGTLIAEAPDDATVLALIIAVHAPGHLKGTKTTRLITVPEAMEAMRRAGTVAYAGPKG